MRATVFEPPTVAYGGEGIKPEPKKPKPPPSPADGDDPKPSDAPKSS